MAADGELDVTKFQLFIPGKAAQTVDQPQYGNDMRTIERWTAYLTAKLIPAVNTTIAGLAAAVAELNTIVTVDIPKTEFGNVGVGTNPPANTQLIDFTFTAAVTFTAGVGSIALTAFSYGYTPIAEAGSGLAQFGVVPDIPTSTLSTLKVGCWNYGATPLPTAYTGVIDVICRILGA